MRTTRFRLGLRILCCCMLFSYPFSVFSQSPVININLSKIEDVELTPANAFNYDVFNHGNNTADVKIKGSIRYKQSNLQAGYTLDLKLMPGNNTIEKEAVSGAIWTFSDNAMRELFMDYGKLPQGTYEYCVSVIPQQTNPEVGNTDITTECSYKTINDLFLINLIDPENNAKIYEHYPMLSWVVNYPFASQLQYRLRVVPVYEGQRNENAITRNNPVFEDKNVFGTSLVYPVTAKPLELFQPYAWTVDAYYKGLLLGGAEVWRFTIIEDSLLKIIPKETSFIDIRREKGYSQLYAVGELKLKYVLDELKADTVQMQMLNKAGQPVKMKKSNWALEYGDNRSVLNFTDDYSLRHMQDYKLLFTNMAGTQYEISFKYINPDFLK